MKPLAKVERRRVSDQVLQQLKAQILDGTLPAGQPLPAELELCQLFGTSRTAVREAVRQLETLGLVHSQQGSRRVVQHRDELWALPLVQEMLMPRGELDLALVPHLMEVHRDFLASVYERAGVRGGPEDWRRLRELAALQAHETDRAAFVKRDFEIWVAMAAAARNPLYGMVMKAFVSALEALLPLVLPLIPFEMLRRQFYGPMLDALEQGRARELRDELREVMEASDRGFLENLKNLRGQPEPASGGPEPRTSP